MLLQEFDMHTCLSPVHASLSGAGVTWQPPCKAEMYMQGTDHMCMRVCEVAGSKMKPKFEAAMQVGLQACR